MADLISGSLTMSPVGTYLFLHGEALGLAFDSHLCLPSLLGVISGL